MENHKIITYIKIHLLWRHFITANYAIIMLKNATRVAFLSVSRVKIDKINATRD